MDMFKQLDLSYKPFTFTTNKVVTYKTNLGAILSIALGVISILAIIGFGLEIVKKENPRVKLSNQINTELNTPNNRLQIFVGISGLAGSKVMDIDRKFNITIRNNEINQNKSNNTIVSTFKMEKCNFSEIP